MQRETIFAAGAPKALGAYSHAVAAGPFVWTAGQLGIDPVSGRMVEGDVRAQLRQALENLRAVLAAAGCTLDDVVKTTVFLADVTDAKAANEVYAEFFRKDPPARSTVGAALPAAAKVEIEAVAIRKE